MLPIVPFGQTTRFDSVLQNRSNIFASGAVVELHRIIFSTRRSNIIRNIIGAGWLTGISVGDIRVLRNHRNRFTSTLLTTRKLSRPQQLVVQFSRVDSRQP